MDILTTLKEVVDSSSQLTTWALSIGGASVAVVVSTSYHRPAFLWQRISYLLFLPGWFLLGFSVFAGDQLIRKRLAALMVSPEKVNKISSDINNLFSEQRFYLLTSLVIFVLWLVIYLFIWIFGNSESRISNEQDN